MKIFKFPIFNIPIYDENWNFFINNFVTTATIRYRDDAAAGMAYVKTACTSHAVSITQSGPMYSTVGLAAHEIGHKYYIYLIFSWCQ